MPSSSPMRDGMIRSANEAFLNLTDARTVSSVKGKSLAEFLSRGSGRSEGADRQRHAGRPDADVRDQAGRRTSGRRLSVEISATYLADRTAPSLVFVIRDTSRAEALRKPGRCGWADDAVRNVMDLVGSAPAQGHRGRDHRCGREDVHRDGGGADPQQPRRRGRDAGPVAAVALREAAQIRASEQGPTERRLRAVSASDVPRACSQSSHPRSHCVKLTCLHLPTRKVSGYT